jgi:hypothetical protein
MMASTEVVEKSIETFRTDPAGFTFVALGMAVQAYLEQHDELSSVARNMAGAAAAGLLVGGLVHIGNMLEYRDRIETSIDEIGVEGTRYRMRAYCPRQVTKVVLQKTGNFEKFKEMRKSATRQRYRFLPHI